MNTVEEVTTGYSETILRLVMVLREMVREQLPELTEFVDVSSRIIAYGKSAKYSDLVYAIVPHTRHINLMFSRGASMPDLDGILQGTGRKARHIHIEELTEGTVRQIQLYLAQAAKEHH